MVDGSRMQFINIFVDIFCNPLSVKMAGIDKMWIIGDEFCDKSCNLYFMETPSRSNYARSTFEVKAVSTNKFRSHTSNTLIRIHNTMTHAMQTQGLLPKLILFIIEDDIIEFINLNDHGITQAFKACITKLVMEVRRSIDTFKEDFLPKKAIRHGWPQIVWVVPTIHDNYINNAQRKRFSGELEQMIKFQPNMTSVRLRLPWDPVDRSLVCEVSHKLTHQGLRAFWEAVDRSTKYINNRLFKPSDDTLNEQDNQRYAHYSYRAEPNFNQRQYHWRRDNFNTRHQENPKFHLPPPSKN